MYFKIRKADGKIMHLTPGPETCKKWHLTRDKNGVIDEIRCFALHHQSKCKDCCLTRTIQNRIRRKTSCKVFKKLKESQ